MDMGSSDEEEEDGQINKFDEEEEQDRKYFSKAPVVEDDGPLTIADLEQIRVSRDYIAKNIFAPWFQDYIVGALRPSATCFDFDSNQRHSCAGAYVRYLVGQDNNMPVYRACEVVGWYHFLRV